MIDFFRDAFETPNEGSEDFLTIEKSALVSNGAAPIGLTLTLWDTYEDVLRPGEQGDCVAFYSIGRIELEHRETIFGEE